MQALEYQITTEYIELNQLLKVCGLAGSGGEGGALVMQGNVMVDGQQELRKRCKIRPGQVVQLGEVRMSVLAAPPEEIAAKAEARIEMARVKAAKKKAKIPPGMWSTAAKAAAKTGAKGGSAGGVNKRGPNGGAPGGAKPGPKARSKHIAAGERIGPAGSAPISVKVKAPSAPKTNVFAAKAEAHRRRKS